MFERNFEEVCFESGTESLVEKTSFEYQERE